MSDHHGEIGNQNIADLIQTGDGRRINYRARHVGLWFDGQGQGWETILFKRCIATRRIDGTEYEHGGSTGLLKGASGTGTGTTLYQYGRSGVTTSVQNTRGCIGTE